MNKKNRVIHLGILILFGTISIFPLKLQFLFSEVITFITYRLIGYRKKVVFQNLRASFPEKTPEEINHIARKYFRHLSVMIVENLNLRFISEKKMSQVIKLENEQLFLDLYAQKRNLIVMVGHLGNWEYGSAITRLIPYSGSAVYKKLSSDAFDKLYFDIRKRLGVDPVEMHDTLRRVIQQNNQSDPYILFMVADQAPPKNDQQHYIQFLNQETGVYLGSEKLAKKFDMPVVFMEIKRIKKGSYCIVPQLITDDPKSTNEFEITEKYYALLEEAIVRNPRYWLWSHRRWKNRPKQ